MRTRFAALAALLLLATACGAAPIEADGPTRALSYSLSGGLDLAYDQTIEMDVAMDFGGSFSQMDPSAPSSMTMAMTMGMRTGYHVEDGPESGTYRVQLDVDDVRFDDVRMAADGEVVDIPAGALDQSIPTDIIPEVTFVMTERGELLEVEFEGESFDLQGLMSGDPFSGLGGQMQLFGPELPDGVVGPGDSWTSTHSQSPIPGGEEITVRSTHEIVDVEEIGGFTTWVIETVSETDGYTVTMEDLMAAMTEFAGDFSGDFSGLDPSLLGGFDMTWTMEPTVARATVWLDPDAGIVRRQLLETEAVMSMRMGGIPGASGAVTMDMDMAMAMTMDLVD